MYIVHVRIHFMLISEDAYSSMAPDPSFAFVRGPSCPTLHFVFAFWIMVMFDTLLTSLFCIHSSFSLGYLNLRHNFIFWRKKIGV
jgi:hypothetical protein